MESVEGVCRKVTREIDAHCYRRIVWKRRTKDNQRIIIVSDKKSRLSTPFFNVTS